MNIPILWPKTLRIDHSSPAIQFTQSRWTQREKSLEISNKFNIENGLALHSGHSTAVSLAIILFTFFFSLIACTSRDQLEVSNRKLEGVIIKIGFYGYIKKVCWLKNFCKWNGYWYSLASVKRKNVRYFQILFSLKIWNFLGRYWKLKFYFHQIYQ